jgi:hypothetical protein
MNGSKVGKNMPEKSLEPIKHWVPLGVWRFREIAKRALETNVKSHTSLDEALNEIATHLRIPMHRWLEVSKLYSEFKSQMKLTDFL